MKYLLSFIFAINLICPAQIKYKSLKYYKYADKNIADSLVIALKNSGARNVIIYQNNDLSGNDISKFSETTFIIWNCDNNTYARKIKDSLIFSLVELKSSKILKYNNIRNCGQTVDEKYYDFDPPWLGAIGIDFLIYYGDNSTFFFEYKDQSPYNNYKSKAKARKEWLAIIKSELQEVHSIFTPERSFRKVETE
ncbi:MAG: hypothetical protein Q8940_21970 [Bacteroidota bacterium]|nr:hypothetical protein [Bacteroidota bacterium]